MLEQHCVGGSLVFHADEFLMSPAPHCLQWCSSQSCVIFGTITWNSINQWLWSYEHKMECRYNVWETYRFLVNLRSSLLVTRDIIYFNIICNIFLLHGKMLSGKHFSFFVWTSNLHKCWRPFWCVASPWVTKREHPSWKFMKYIFLIQLATSHFEIWITFHACHILFPWKPVYHHQGFQFNEIDHYYLKC